MKIFVSYSRRDADFAQQIYDYFKESEYNVFTDVNNIQLGEHWSDVVSNNISNCDVFVIILTYASIRSKEVEKEVLQAQSENKIIIPCIQRDLSHEEIDWNLSQLQGIEFNDKYELARESLFPNSKKSQEEG